MLIFDLVVYLLLFVMALIVLVRFFVVYRGFLPLISIALLIVVLFIFKSSLPKIFEYPINSFFITYHNADEGRFTPKQGTKVDVDFYIDKTKKFYVKMDGYFINFAPVTKEIYIDNHWAKVEMFLDGKKIESTTEMKKDMVQRFSTGIHHLEIYVYNTGISATMMHVGMNDYVPIISDQNLTAQLKKLFENKEYERFFTTQYLNKTIDMNSSTKPSVLFLNSTVAATYNIKNVKASDLKAVVYSGVGVRVHQDGDAKVYRIQSMPEVNTIVPKTLQCVNQAPMGINCPNFDNYTRLNEWMQKLTNKKINGFTKTEDKRADSISVPQVRLDAAVDENIQKIMAYIEMQKKEMNKKLLDPFYMYEGKRWFDIFHVKEEDIPSNSFRAYYLDMFDVPNVKYSEVVPKIALVYSGHTFHGIKADDFIGYWVGDFMFARPLTYEIDLTTFSHVKILINGKTVHAGNGGTSLKYQFIPGKQYRIEIEYISNFGEVNMALDIKKSL